MEFKKGNVIGLYMGKCVETMLNENNSKWQLKNLVVDGKIFYMGMYFINDPLYNYHVKNNKLDEVAAKAHNRTISQKKRRNDYIFNVEFRFNYIVEATYCINKGQEITTYYNYENNNIS